MPHVVLFTRPMTFLPDVFSAECQKGFFGENCSKKCNCTRFDMCNAVTGNCKRGREGVLFYVVSSEFTVMFRIGGTCNDI